MEKAEYYLMRHADYYGRLGQFVTYRGMLALKKQMEKLEVELAQKFPDRELCIVHSELPRAFHTALLMREMMGGSIRISLRVDSSLNSDKLLITENYVKLVVTSCEHNNKICLILSHQPDIKHFCKDEFENSEYQCKSIEIEDRAVEESGASDDLPF
jgi:hypothetical protein